MKIKNKPKHIAIIIDGNRRWAFRYSKKKSIGHKNGCKVTTKIIKSIIRQSIDCLTLYIFSYENWKRLKYEVSILMNIIHNYLLNQYNNFTEKKIKIKIIDEKNKISIKMREKINNIEFKTKKNKNFNLILAISYSSKNEISRIFKIIFNKFNNNFFINENLISSYLDTRNIPNPDILIRTGGNFRLSNFLLWQISYTEIYTTVTLWPNFNKKKLKKALINFNSRKRKFGSL